MFVIGATLIVLVLLLPNGVAGAIAWILVKIKRKTVEGTNVNRR
jgi:hypothetical protein